MIVKSKKTNNIIEPDIPEGIKSKIKNYKRLKDGNYEITFRDNIDWLSLLSDSDTAEFARPFVSCTRKQFMIGIKLWKWNGRALEPQIQAVIDSLPQQQRLVAQTSFSEAGSFSRTDTMLIQLAQALGMEDSDIDEFFTYCASEAWL